MFKVSILHATTLVQPPPLRIDISQGKPGCFRLFANVDRLGNSLRAGHSAMDSQAGEIDANETHTENEVDSSGTVLESHSYLDDKKKTCRSHASLDRIRTRLQQMESEVSAVLNALKSDANTDKSLKLNNAWEFRETDIMSQQARFRSIRAKLAVLEGRRALALIEAKMLVDQKQKRIDKVCKALQLLRTVYVVWPYDGASEVLLTGSFDGWATQRKMEKSSRGVFSLDMKLYPGKYEIKFIVDGDWKIDPLLPTINSDVFVNNLLIIH